MVEVPELRRTRTVADVTQFELAKKSGVERTRISLAENGHIEVRLEEYNALMHALVDMIRSRVLELQFVLSQIGLAGDENNKVDLEVMP